MTLKIINKLVKLSLLFFYCSVLFWLSSRSSLPTPLLFPHQDKMIHMMAYFIMGILAWHFFYDYIHNTTICVFISLSYCSVYGLLDEWHQSYVPGRDADILDWVADTTGALIALLWIEKRKIKKLNRLILVRLNAFFINTK